MTKSLYILILVLIGLNSCTSQKKLQNNPPFVVEEPTIHKWKTSIEENDSGIQVKIPIRQLVEEDITFKNLYFRGKIAKITIENSNGIKYVTANFLTEKLQKPDIIMHSNPKKEVGNQAPKLNKDKEIEFPFELADDEAVLSYVAMNGEKLKYTKVIGIKEK